jgi:hypothetical protein
MRGAEGPHAASLKHRRSAARGRLCGHGLGAVPQRFVERVVVVLNRAAHQFLEHGGDPTREILDVCDAHNFRGRKDAELAVGERALAIAAHGENPDLARFHPHFPVALALEANDRQADAEQMFSTGMRVREELGTVWDLPLYQAGLAELHCQMGKWDEALVEADTGITIGEEVGTRLGIVLCAAVAALINVHRDDLAAADRLLSLAREMIDRAGPQWGGYWAILASAALADARGDRDTALTVLCDAWAAHGHSSGLQVYLGTPLVQLALATGEPELARSVAATVQSNARDMDAPSAKGSSLPCVGLAERDSESLARAVTEFRASGWLPHLAVACEETATALARDDDPTAARALFE